MSPKFNTGRHVLQDEAKNTNGKSRIQNRGDWINFFSLKAGESAYLHFTTGEDDLAKVGMHRFVKVAFKDNDNNLKEGYVNLVSRDPGVFDDGDGTDWQKIMREDVQHKYDIKIAGLAVTLDAVGKEKGKEPTRIADVDRLVVRGRFWTPKEGDDIFFPDYQLVFQAKSNFWNALDVHASEIGPINQGAFKITRHGGDRETQYFSHHLNVKIVLPDGDGNPTDEEVNWDSLAGIPMLSEVLESLGNHDRYVKYFGDKSLWREQEYYNKPGYKESDDDESESTEDTGSAFSKIKAKAETYK